MKKPLVKKENLENLLRLLPHLMQAEGNEWFKTEVRKLAFPNEKASGLDSDTLHSFAENGSHYLIINPNALLIDYDDIPDEKVRTQLRADCFEMTRHRLGRINHKPNFDEFCRYAHLQIEELANYYYQKKFGNNISRIKAQILQYNPGVAEKIKKATQLTWIGIIYKIWALNDMFGMGAKAKNLMSNICYLRNELSHRTSLTKEQDEETLISFEKQKGPIGELPLSEQPTKIQIILFRKEQSWDEVYNVITKFKSKIMESI